MLVKDAIRHLQSMSPDDTICMPIWQTGDIENTDLTEQEKIDVIGLMERRHDCTIGINWEVLDCHIESVIVNRKGVDDEA